MEIPKIDFDKSKHLGIQVMNIEQLLKNQRTIVPLSFTVLNSS